MPKIDHEVTTPRKDFQRATREEIYDFCREDLEYASNNLTREADGRGGITAGVADHLLSEIYICLGRWQDAVNAAKALSTESEKAVAFHDNVLPVMDALRAAADDAETICGEDYWPLPSYSKMLYYV